MEDELLWVGQAIVNIHTPEKDNWSDHPRLLVVVPATAGGSCDGYSVSPKPAQSISTEIYAVSEIDNLTLALTKLSQHIHGSRND